MSFSRIYQGRVSRVEIQDAEAEGGWRKIEDWQAALWQHHALFQDAVNYYSAALFAMATNEKSPLWSVRQRLGNVWEEFRRKGQTRSGMKNSLAGCLNVDVKGLGIEDCFERILKGNTSDPELLELALRELLLECDGDGAIQQKGREMLPRFCWAGFKGSYPKRASQFERAEGESRLQSEFHELEGEEALLAFAKESQLSWTVNLIEGAEPSEGEASRNRLEKAVGHFMQAFGEKALTSMGERVKAFLSEREEAQTELESIRLQLSKMDTKEMPPIPKNARSIPDRTEALLLFKYFTCPFTVELLRVSFPPKKAKRVEVDSVTQELIHFGDDPIFLARGKRGYVFPAFSALPRMGGDGVEPTWKEFDIAAFKEALKALHQIEVKTEERAKKREALDYVRDAQYGLAKWKATGESEEELAPALLEGDVRLERLTKILSEDLAVKNEFTDLEGAMRGVSRRALRGFEELRLKWNKIAPYGSEKSESLKEKLERSRKDYQTQQGDKQGDSALFKALVEPENWVIWQVIPEEVKGEWSKSTEVKSNLEYADNILRAYQARLDLDRQIERLKEPINFTPADARHSQRQFYFSDVCAFKPKGRYHHEKGKPGTGLFSVLVPMAVKNGQGYQLANIRLSYSAPRLLRDGLRSEEGTLVAAPFSQPMMKALGIADELPQDIHKHAVALMPKQRRESEVQELNSPQEWAYLLNFPISLDTEKLLKKLGPNRFDWSSQFASFDGKNFYLLWPSLIKGRKEPKAGWWWEKVKSFSVLSVDLGQRDAAAYATQEIFRVGNGRTIGFADEVEWKASLKEMGMLKLVGEDAQILGKGGQWEQEMYGSRGRRQEICAKKCIDEVQEALDVAKRLGVGFEEDFKYDSWKLLMYPESNDRLLRLLRRAQGWLARIRGYCLDLALEDKKQDALDAIWSDERLAKKLIVPQKEDAKLVQESLTRFVVGYRETVAECLVTIANRILPLRDGVWEWVKNPISSDCHILRRSLGDYDLWKRKRAGQRGLSLARIEQLESLRQRVQSLNRVMRFAPDDPQSRKSLRDVELPDPCPDILNKLETLKEQRVKQTAQMILAQALGVRLRPHQTEKAIRRKKDMHGEYERFRDRAVDFIVVEDLSGYLSRQDKAPSENTRLMQWSHRALLDTLKELCEPYGIQIVEANAAFSSKFCSRTGEVGFRAREVNAKDFEDGGRFAFPLGKYEKFKRGEVSLSKSREGELAYLCGLAEVLKSNPAKKRRTLFVPEDGGAIFISAVSKKWMQADMNAAINVGLRGISEPSRHEFFPKIRTEKKGESLFVRADSKRELARWAEADREVALVETERGSEFEARVPNLFWGIPDFCTKNEYRKFYCYGEVGGVKVSTSKSLWTAVKQEKWEICREINDARLKQWGIGEVVVGDEEDVPY